MHLAKFLPAAAALLAAASCASADSSFSDSVAYWDQYGQSGSQTATLGVGVDHIAVESMVRGSGLGANTGANSLNSKGWNGEATDYVEFGFSVDSGYVATLDKLYLATKVSSTGPTMAQIYTSLNGYSSSIGTIAQDNASGSYINGVIDLSSLGSITGTVTFRLFASGASSTNGTLRIGDYSDGSTYYFDSITGSVAAVPEPDTYAMFLAGLGLMGFIARRRAK